MAIQVINIGTSPNKGDGEPLRTAFDKINDNFSELSLKVTNLETGGVTVTTGDIKGSVFGDDSTLLVDGVNSTIPSANLSGALPAIDGSALTGLFSGAFANLTGKPTTIAGYGITDALTSVPAQSFASLTGKPTTVAGYGITDAHTGAFDGEVTGSVFGDDSTLLVDGNNNKIVGPVLSSDLRSTTSNVRIGLDAGLTNQGTYSIAIGERAGNLNQSADGIAIGCLLYTSDAADE